MNKLYPRLLTIQDLSCFGQCSLTVALPVLSACGVETAVLPTALLSTLTGGFEGFTFRSLTDEMERIAAHWQHEDICFDAIYTGYLGDKQHGAHRDGSFVFLELSQYPDGKKQNNGMNDGAEK